MEVVAGKFLKVRSKSPEVLVMWVEVVETIEVYGNVKAKWPKVPISEVKVSQNPTCIAKIG